MNSSATIVRAMVSHTLRKARVTPTHTEEAARLRSLWDSTEHPAQAAFGEQYGIGNQSAVGQFLRGQTPLSLKAAIGFAQGLRCNVADFSPRLAEEIARGMTVAPNEEDEFAQIRHADVAFAQGHGQVVYQEGDKSALSFRKDYLRKIGVSVRTAVVVDAKGRSNEPVISDGAVLLVNTAEGKIRDGKFYAFRQDGMLYVKRLYTLKDGTLRAVSENPDRDQYPDMLIDASGDFELIGRVMWMASEV